MSFNTKFLIQQGRKKLNILDSQLPKINQRVNTIGSTNAGANAISFTKKDLQEIVEIYCKEAYDRLDEEKQIVLQKVNKLPFLKKAIRRKGEAFVISALNQMTLEYYNCGQELYNVCEGNKQNFFILVSGFVGIYVSNDLFILQEKEEEEQKQAEAAALIKNQQNEVNGNNKGSSNKVFNVEVKQMGVAQLRRKADNYVDKQREKENQANQNRSQLKNDSKINGNNGGSGGENMNNSQIYLPLQESNSQNGKNNQKEIITKEKIRELNKIQENLTKKQAREFKEVKVIQALSTLGERKNIQSEGNLDIQKIVVKSGQAIALMLKGETFRQLFNELIESEEKISKIAFFLSIPLFSNFKMREINQIMQKTRIQIFTKQQMVYNENEEATNLYIVKTGEFAIQKGITIKNPQMHDLYNKKTVRNIEICSLTEGQFFGLDELLESTQLQNTLESNQDGVNVKMNNIRRLNSVKCKTAESELFVIPYDSFKKYISPDMINIDSSSFQQQVELRNEMLSKKRIQEERQELKMITIKRNIQSECSKYHVIQSEINIQQKDMQNKYQQRLLNDSSSAIILPSIQDQNISIQTGYLRKQVSFHGANSITDNEVQLHNNTINKDCFLTKIPDHHQNREYNYCNLLVKQQQLKETAHRNYTKNDLNGNRNNLSQFSISTYNTNMQKYIRAISEFSDNKIQTEPSQHFRSTSQIGTNQPPFLEIKQQKQETRIQANKIINQLNYMLPNPSQMREKRSQTQNSSHQEKNAILNSSTYQNENNSIRQLSPKQQKTQTDKVELKDDTKQNGVQKVDRLFNYLNELENHPQTNMQSNLSTLHLKDGSLNNSICDQTQINKAGNNSKQKYKYINAKKQLQSISSYNQEKQANTTEYIEDIDEIEHHLNRKDIMIQIINNNSQHVLSKQQNNNNKSNNNNNNNQTVQNNNLNSTTTHKVYSNSDNLNKSDNMQKYTTFGDNNSGRSNSMNQPNDKKQNVTSYQSIEKSAHTNPLYNKQKNQIKQLVQNKMKNSLQQHEQIQIEKLLDEINENYNKVPIKPLMVSPSCAVKNAKRLIKKSRKGAQHAMAYPLEYYYLNQPLSEFNLLPDQSAHYNYNLQIINNKTLNQQNDISFQKE